MLLGAFQSTIAVAAPDLDSIQIAPSGYTTTLLDTDGKTIQTLVGKDANRQYVTLDQIPVNLQNAFIAIEDERFTPIMVLIFRGILRAFCTGTCQWRTLQPGCQHTDPAAVKKPGV